MHWHKSIAALVAIGSFGACHNDDECASAWSRTEAQVGLLREAVARCERGLSTVAHIEQPERTSIVSQSVEDWGTALSDLLERLKHIEDRLEQLNRREIDVADPVQQRDNRGQLASRAETEPENVETEYFCSPVSRFYAQFGRPDDVKFQGAGIVVWIYKLPNNKWLQIRFISGVLHHITVTPYQMK